MTIKKTSEANGSDNQHLTSVASPSPEVLAALGSLSLSLLPLWRRHLATSRAHSEAAVSEMLQAFSSFGPYLQKSVNQSEKVSQSMGSSSGSPGLSGLAEACADEFMSFSSSLDEQGLASVQRISSMIRQVSDSVLSLITPLTHGAQEVSEKLDRMYVGFQYQDRVDQMMALLEEDMTRLNDLLLEPGTQAKELQVEPWLARLESLYAMAEQRTDHGEAGHSSRPDADTETSFF